MSHDIEYVLGMLTTCACGTHTLGVEGRLQHLAEVEGAEK